MCVTMCDRDNKCDEEEDGMPHDGCDDVATVAVCITT